MEKINIAELLKDCPKGMELDCSIHNRPVIFNCVKMGNDYPIRISSKDGFNHSLTYWGSIYNCEDAKCIIFPKGKNTWEGFVPPCRFKDGDIIADEQGNIAIYKQIHKFFNEPHVDFYCGLAHCNELFVIKNDEYQNWGKIKYIEFATKEEKEKLFNALKNNGYRWNAETKTLDKLIKPKFKVRDKIRHSIIKTDDIYHIIGIKDSQYQLIKNKEVQNYYISIISQDDWELVLDKFDFTTLKPFDKVLARCSSLEKWRIQLFEKYDETCKFPFICMGYNKYTQCIPYEENKHLLDKTDDCDEYYKNW